MKVYLGLALVMPWTERITVGHFSGDLINGQLLITATTTNPEVISGLAFGVFSLVDDDSGVRTLGEARYYPRLEPTTLALGYGDKTTVSGDLVFEPRAYNLRWLKRAESGGFWSIAVEAETPSGVATPAFTPLGVARDGASLSIGQTVTSVGDVAQIQWPE